MARSPSEATAALPDPDPGLDDRFRPCATEFPTSASATEEASACVDGEGVLFATQAALFRGCGAPSEGSWLWLPPTARV